MATNLDIDDRLIEDARRAGAHRTKKAAVVAALEEYVRRRRLEQLLGLIGTVDYGEDWDLGAYRREQRELADKRAGDRWPE